MVMLLFDEKNEKLIWGNKGNKPNDVGSLYFSKPLVLNRIQFNQ